MPLSRVCKKIDRPGFTLIEVMMGMAILSMISIIVGNWFFMQRNYQQRINQTSDIQENFRRANWDMIQELQIARFIIWPRMNSDRSIKSDSKVVFKDFLGNIVAFYHVPATGEIRRCEIPNGPGNAEVDSIPIAKGIASVSFTASDFANRFIAIHLTASGVHSLDAVYLLNNG